MKHGIFSVEVNGTVLQGKGEFTINPGIDTQTAIMNTNGSIAGVSGEPKAGSIKGSITLDEAIDPAEFAAIRDAVFKLNFTDGPNYVLSEAFYSADGDLTTTEGEFQCEFMGNLVKL